MDINGKYALVTGGASGIGLAVARALKQAGAAGLLVADVDDAAGARAAAELAGAGCKALFRHTDVSDPRDVQAMLQDAVRHFGDLQILFNNAGIMLGNPGWPGASLERIGRGVNINLLGVMYGTRAALDLMKPGSAIVNTASPAGFGPMPFDPMYSCTKAAIINFTMACAPLAASHGIRVNVVMPGVTETPILRKSGDGNEAADWLKPLLAVVNILSVEDIAKGVLELIGDDSRAGEALSIENPATPGGTVNYVRLRDNAEFHQRALGR